MKYAGEEHSCRAVEMGRLVLNGTETLSTRGVDQAAKWGQTDHGCCHCLTGSQWRLSVFFKCACMCTLVSYKCRY